MPVDPRNPRQAAASSAWLRGQRSSATGRRDRVVEQLDRMRGTQRHPALARDRLHLQRAARIRARNDLRRDAANVVDFPFADLVRRRRLEEIVRPRTAAALIALWDFRRGRDPESRATERAALRAHVARAPDGRHRDRRRAARAEHARRGVRAARGIPRRRGPWQQRPRRVSPSAVHSPAGRRTA